ncbi:MAG: N-acetylglucosamine-6-phosphate deacetylase [Fretibacterium sp.]|nr:N-acetylglucosamine-6-phosphate deacetylase [Fretibacterium sp.]
MRLENGQVYCPDGVFRRGTLHVEGGVFVEASAPGPVFDAEGLTLIPGLTDVHFHGCMGRDRCEGTEAAIQAIADYEESAGVTTLCPATMTLPEGRLIEIVSAAGRFSGETGAALVGIDMEGPFISLEKRGAQNPRYIRRPDAALFERVREASGGLVKIVTVAPEVEGAMEFIDRERDRAILSIAHTACDYDTAREAFARGARHVTHLYNAMPPMGHREPGPILAALERDDVTIELICDGVHVHPAVIRNTLRMFGKDRVIFISDSMEATGMPDGRYTLGELPVVKRGNRALLSDGTIAGSVTDLMGCLRTAVLGMGVPLETAVRCAAVNPARLIGIHDRYGSLEPGRVANLVALDKELNVVMVLNRGRVRPPRSADTPS